MREIKFEFIYGYCGDYKKAYATLDDLLTNTNEDDLYEKATEDMCEFSDVGEYELIAKRQYTELKDKNGVEIYEGDIIQMYSHSFNTNKHEKDTRMQYKEKEVELAHYEHIGDTNDIRIVEHRYGTLGLYGEDGAGGVFTNFYGLNRPGQSIEVIGNIYENPEQLETV